MHTACAPIQSALAMSVPRRKPLSTRTGIRPPTASIISGKASMVERPLSSARSMIRDDNRVDTGVSRELGILMSENALDYDFHFGCVAQPLEKIPCHRGRLVLTDDESCKVDSIIHGSAPHVSLQAA